MPTHVRKQIRDAVKAALAGLSLTGDRVETGRTRPLGDNYLPTILIYTSVETAQRAVYGNPPTLERPLTLYVDCRASGTEPVDDDLDAIAEQVEPAMAVDPTLGGLVLDLKYMGIQSVVEAPGVRHIGSARMEYRVTYRTLEGAPDTAV